MKVRPAGSFQSFDEAMQAAVDIADWPALIAYLQDRYDFWKPTDDMVTIEPYGRDARNGWNTHLICVRGNAALFSDGPMARPTASARVNP